MDMLNTERYTLCYFSDSVIARGLVPGDFSICTISICLMQVHSILDT